MTGTISATTPAQLMQLFSERAANGDLAGLLGLYEVDAALELEIGTVVRGHDEIGAALEGLVQLRPQITSAGEPDVVIVGDIALVANTFVMTADLPDGTTLRQGGLSADVLRRQPDGTWLVLIDQPRGATLST